MLTIIAILFQIQFIIITNGIIIDSIISNWNIAISNETNRFEFDNSVSVITIC